MATEQDLLDVASGAEKSRRVAWARAYEAEKRSAAAERVLAEAFSHALDVCDEKVREEVLARLAWLKLYYADHGLQAHSELLHDVIVRGIQRHG